MTSSLSVICGNCFRSAASTSGLGFRAQAALQLLRIQIHFPVSDSSSGNSCAEACASDASSSAASRVAIARAYLMGLPLLPGLQHRLGLLPRPDPGLHDLAGTDIRVKAGLLVVPADNGIVVLFFIVPDAIADQLIIFDPLFPCSGRPNRIQRLHRFGFSADKTVVVRCCGVLGGLPSSFQPSFLPSLR